nr:hypothetical protein GCM10025730_02450 [Promicromonospora thailandica]
MAHLDDTHVDDRHVGDASARTGDPAPDDRRKPGSPPDLRGRTWGYVLRATVRQFSRDQCLDLAAALTYYAVLAAAPALLALVSVLGLVGNGGQAVERVVGTLEGVVPPDALNVVEPLVENAAGGGAGQASPSSSVSCSPCGPHPATSAPSGAR